MDTYSISDPNFQSSPGLSDAHWCLAIPHRPTTVAGKYIQDRYRVCTALADLIANVVMTVTASPRPRGEVA